MPSQKLQRPRVNAQVIEHQTPDMDSQQRMMSQLAQIVAQNTPTSRNVVVVDLVVGTNSVIHGLGRRARGCHVVPTTADATFAWGFAVDGDLKATITVVGADQPASVIEFF